MLWREDSMRGPLKFVAFAIAAFAALSLASCPVAAKDDDWPKLVESPEKVKPGETRMLKAPKGMTYFLRVPNSYDPKKGARLVVWMHGSNMNGMAYVGSFEEKRWCEDDLLVCPNGEQVRDEKGHVYNFTEQSGPLVADLTEQVKKAFKTTITYAGGHSQGAYLTYNLVLCHPDLYQGAIPFAGDVWMQNEPNGWEDKPDVLEKQLKIPFAIIHSPDDPVVDFSQGQHAYDCFRGMGWPRLRFFQPPGVGHMFMPAPIDQAFAWVDAMNGREEKKSLELIDDWIKAAEWGWATEAAAALAAAPGATPAAKAAPAKVAKAAEAPAKKAVADMQASMEKNPAAKWVLEWLEFRRVYGSTAPAKAICKKYDDARDKERAEGDRLFGTAMGHFRSNPPRRDEGFAAYEQILKEAPHTYYAWYAASGLKERGADAGQGGKDGGKDTGKGGGKKK
jgi:predicted esterase